MESLIVESEIRKKNQETQMLKKINMSVLNRISLTNNLKYIHK